MVKERKDRLTYNKITHAYIIVITHNLFNHYHDPQTIRGLQIIIQLT